MHHFQEKESEREFGKAWFKRGSENIRKKTPGNYIYIERVETVRNRERKRCLRDLIGLPLASTRQH